VVGCSGQRDWLHKRVSAADLFVDAFHFLVHFCDESSERYKIVVI
jgi:hypothetical protein